MLSESSVLFYDEPAYRLGRPIVGGPWLNTRDSAGYEWTGDRHVIRKAHQLRLDNLRWAGAASEGYLIEPASYQKIMAPFDFANARWSYGNITRSDALSVFEGKVASKLTATGAGPAIMAQYPPSGEWTGARETATWEIETGSAAWISLGMYDATAGVWANLCYFEVATETLTPYGGNAGTNRWQYVRKLSDSGRNGGKIYRFRLSATHTAGRARYAYTYIGTGGTEPAGTSIFPHYVGWEEGSWGSTPFEDILVRDDLSAPPIPSGIPWCGCLEFTAGAVIGLDLYNVWHAIRSAAGSGAPPFFFIYSQPGSSLVIVRYSDGVTDRQAYVPIDFGEGDPVTVTWAVHPADGSGYDGCIFAQARVGNGRMYAATSATGGFAPWPAGSSIHIGAFDETGLYPVRNWYRRLGIYKSADLIGTAGPYLIPDDQEVHRQCSLFRLDPAGRMLRSG